MVLICVRVMYLCIHSARPHATVTSHKSKGPRTPERSSNNKKHKKKEQQQQQQLSHQEYNSDDDTTTKAACPGAPGAPAWLTDPNPGRGHITSASPSHGGQKPSGRFYNLREAEPAHVSGRGVKLETGDGGEQDKGAARGLFMVTRPPSPTPCHLQGVVARRDVCV